MLFITLQVLYVAVVCLLCSGQRVLIECGAKLDVVDVQGLILSPGFPHNYSSGTHCVWQFFIPSGHQLMMEMFDFDIFESSERRLGEEHLLTEALSQSDPKGPNKMEFSNSMFPSSLEDQTVPPSSTPTTIGEDEPETPHLATDVCPNDVLYITDLITFSSRFCGSTSPSDHQLVFGSDSEMVEVIMELITSTPWGRGFALIFRYSNRSAIEVEGQRSSAPSFGAVETVLAAISFATLFATSLVICLCVTLRTKLCAKESTITSSITSTVPVQNLHTDGSELQLVTTNHPGELNKNDNTLSTPHLGNIPECQSSQSVLLESSHGLMEMELGTDEVFVISNTDTPSFSACMHQERFLHSSDTRSVRPSDWMPRSEPCNWPSHGSHVGSVRPRAWSVRNFHDFLLPLPQLSRKWCSWNLTSPFTKLVDTVSPGPVVDGGFDMRVSSAQNQHYYVTTRSHMSQHLSELDGAPCGPEQGVHVKVGGFCSTTTADDDYNCTIPTFTISEDDRELLVSGEHQNQMKSDVVRNHELFSSLGSTHSTCRDEDLKNMSSKIHLPSLSHVTMLCDSVEKDM